MLGGSFIRGFVLSVIIVFFLLLSSVPLPFVQDDDHILVESVSGLIADQPIENETFWLDTYGLDVHVDYSQKKLLDSVTYRITFEGTWSGWPQNWWTDGVPPVGPVEDVPMYPSQDGGEKTGKVGADPFWGFAYPQGENYARSIGAWPLPAKWSTIFITLDKGASWAEDPPIRPATDAYNPLHKYEITVVGKGEAIGFCFDDTKTVDNCGMFKIVIEPQLNDTDGDGLFDEWEINGVDGDSDGDIDLVLKDADWQHKDIFVEVDYMQGIMPNPLALEDVRIAFSKAPVQNPDGKTGINLHIILDQQCFWHLGTNWSEFDAIKSNYFGNYEIRDDPNGVAILKAKALVEHYCLFVNQLTEKDAGNNTIFTKYSGMGECPGNDFMVSLGHAGGGSRMEQSSTLMHELGHNLGLRHGGIDDTNYKPNYLSIMNYMFQFNYDFPNRPMDFSRVKLTTLDESALNEVDGVGVDYISAGSGGWLFTGHRDPTRNKSVISLLRPIDWDCDKHYNTSVRANVNDCTDWDYSSAPNEILEGFNDWENIILPFQGLPTFADKVHGESPEEMTTDVMLLMKESALNYHDVALVIATLSSTVIDQNDILDVTVKSVNLGANNETADLSIYAGTALIAQRTVSLERSNITSTTLRCDVSTVPKGHQVITVRLAQVPGEEDAFDNDFTYGVIEFTGETTPENGEESWPLVIGVAGVVVAVIMIALFVVLRKRGKAV